MLTRLAMLDFVVRLGSVTKVIYPGPVRHHRTCGGIYGDGWDMNLKNPITIIRSLANGAIIAFSKRVSKGAKHPGAVEYNVRMPDDRGKDHSDRDKMRKERHAKYTLESHALPEGFDLIDGIPLPDGTVLLSLGRDHYNSHDSLCLILDPLSHKTQVLEIPGLSSLGGHLCLINPTHFALHSDKFYVVEKNELGWQAKFAIDIPNGGSSPVANGKDLVAYCTRNAPERRLCVMNTQSGKIVYDHRFDNNLIKPILFLDEERLLFFNGEFYSVLNLSTRAIQALEKHEETDITDPKYAWASLTTTGELYVGGGTQYEVLDPRTFRRFSFGELRAIEQLFIDCKGDLKCINKGGVVKHNPTRFFVMDLSFRQKEQGNYRYVRTNNDTLQIICPNKDLTQALDIDDGAPCAKWTLQMFSGNPTSKTLYDMLYGFFETYCYDYEKHAVTYKDNVIQVTGLSAEEVSQLGTLLNILLKRTPSLALQNDHPCLSQPQQLPRSEQSSRSVDQDEKVQSLSTSTELLF